LLFGLYCVNHVLLPLLQDWLRRPASVSFCKDPSRSTDSVNPVPPAWEFAATFKQYVGLTTDLVVEYLNTYLTSPTEDRSGETYYCRRFCCCRISVMTICCCIS
jgi:hypothetical protein